MKRSTVLIGCSVVAATLAATFQFAGGLGGDAPAAGESEVVSTAESSTSTETTSGVVASSGVETSSTVPVSRPAVTSPPTPPSASSTSTSSTSTSSTSTVPVDGPLSEILVELGGLVVADPDPGRPSYDRDTYQPGGWADLDGDCISGRHEVLITQSEVPVGMDPSGCFVDTGLWTDPYTGTVVSAASDITIDHVVPLSEAHRAGAWRWDRDTRVAFAHDETPGALLPVVGSVNQAKGDKTPDEWLPPRQEFHCTYAANWVITKSRWQLTITQPEAMTLTQILSSCTDGDLPDRPVAAPPSTVLAPPLTPTTTGSATPAGAGREVVQGNGSGELQVVECQRREERVVLVNPTANAISLAGYRLHDEESRHSTTLDQFGSIAAGGRLVILTGEDAVESPGEVVWKRQNVWNNDGDTAYLVTPTGSVTTARC